jgi:protein involved in ribonucleotide reduction
MDGVFSSEFCKVNRQILRGVTLLMALYIMAVRHLRAFLALLIWESSFVVCDGTVSIASSNAFITQRPCVRGCIMGASNGIDLGCGSPLLNSCFCRADLQSSALYQVSSCVSVNCNDTTTDINNVISLYTAYCSTATLSTMSAAATAVNTTVSIASSNEYSSTATSITAAAVNTTATNSRTENDLTVSITSSNAYATQRPCVQDCIMGASDGIDLGCGSPLLNSCFCRTDLQSFAVYQISSCISVNCNGTTTDINNVISLYTVYCSTATLSTTSAAATAVNTTVSIASSNAYATQRPCVQDCIMGASNGIDVRCGNPLLNSCFCRADLQSSAVYQVSSCVSVNCNGATTDINNAISLYTVYCSSDTLTASMAATSSPGEAQPSVTSSGSSTAQSTGKSCSWLLQLMHSWYGAWALGNPLEIMQKLTLAAFSELCWRRRRHIKG